jgi:hypothetical protein
MSKDVIFFRDDEDIFECNIKVNGSSLNNTKARMIFEFSDRSYVFNGKIDKDGLVKVNIPRLSEIKDNKGKANLEVIVDSLLFTPWQSEFKLEDKNNVVVESISINRKQDVNLVVENVTTPSKPKKSILTEDCSSKNKKIISEILKTKVKKDLTNYLPTYKLANWLDDNFKNPESYDAKYCAYILENRIEKRK